MSLQVPKADEEPLRKLIDLAPEKMVALKAALSKAPPGLLLRDWAKKIADDAHIPTEDTLGMIRVLAKLYGERPPASAELGGFVDEVAEAAEAAGLAPPTAGWDRFRSDLVELLSVGGSLSVTAKALEVMAEHERILCNARILTDIRPVFDEATKVPPAALIIHNLRIRYHHEGNFNETREFFVALDGDDLRRLQTIIDRAVDKENALRSLLRNAGVPSLEADAH